jgi:hypothetical protein
MRVGTRTGHETATSPAKQTTLGKPESIMLSPDATEPFRPMQQSPNAALH